eukprot:2362868-Amphidinium_carterae.1
MTTQAHRVHPYRSERNAASMSHHVRTRTKFKSTPPTTDHDIQKELSAVAVALQHMSMTSKMNSTP